MDFFPLCVSLCFFLYSSIYVMAANNNNNNRVSFPPGFNSILSNTTFVQATPASCRADQSTFRVVVQRLTGVTNDSSLKKLPVTVFVAGGGGAGPYFLSSIAAASQRSLRNSPGTPTPWLTPEEEEERAIAKKCFYFSKPELLPLFPLHSPGDSISSPSITS
ncbi:hypothetical protein NE237_006088 [Protea cynaroides]|uniref:Uncharacterized protein n=1 Tax=Protea cynaroides TaxID=273540 RepID=A0A9Q0QV75_9MAGN|nr:hypothetical protein NE237_006088 [Protea cynaroides]